MLERVTGRSGPPQVLRQAKQEPVRHRETSHQAAPGQSVVRKCATHLGASQGPVASQSRMDLLLVPAARKRSWLITEGEKCYVSCQRCIEKLPGERRAKQMFAHTVPSVLVASKNINSNTSFSRTY